MYHFFYVTFTKNGQDTEQVVIATEQQANDFAITEASKNGSTYCVKRAATEQYDSIKNLANH